MQAFLGYYRVQTDDFKMQERQTWSFTTLPAFCQKKKKKWTPPTRAEQAPLSQWWRLLDSGGEAAKPSVARGINHSSEKGFT